MNQDDRLGPYRLLKRLGEGGMGVVHLAFDARGRQVAVKVLRPEVAGDDVARRRLSREVETMRRVRGSHIAEVVDADVTGRRPYIVTRYVPGRAIDEMVKQDGPFSLDVLLKVARGVAEALVAVHAAGVIHRDLKPGNVLMLDEEPVLIDFGIAQAVDATRLTQTGMFIGTPGYLAPEIIEGQEGGSEVDVHAWAGTLLYAATGQPPFGKGTLEMIFFNITSGKANVEAAPELLRPVLRAAFHRDPAKRPAAAELLQWIDRLTPRRGGYTAPDEISTVAEVDEAADAREKSGPSRPSGVSGPSGLPGYATPSAPSVPSVPSAPSGPRWSPSSGPSPANGGSGQAAGEFVSLLDDGPAAHQGDPFPTVRVTGEDLRKAGLPSGATGRPGDPARFGQGSGPSGRPPVEGDIPTRRVTSEELRESAMPSQAFYEQAPGFKPPEAYEHTPRVQQPHPAPFLPTVRVPPHEVPPHGAPPHGVPPYRAAPHVASPTMGAPLAGAPGTAGTVPSARVAPATGGALLQRSKAYGVASTMLLIAMTGLAVIAPARVCLIALPAVILLRAADLAQPRLSSRRPAGAAAADVVRVLAEPASLIKSIGIMALLVPLAAVPGTFVTVLLALLARSMPVSAAVSWGVAVGLLIVCAGPGVQGPGRQMRRTLASLAPGGAAAVKLAWGAGVLAVLVGLVALTSVGGRPIAGHLWGSVDVQSVHQRLTELRGTGYR
jgi:serine/threonine protein kinase